ncbi:hypothetical protein HPB48_006189 [Haemaphysalis longicornis]|uniref:TRAF1-6 MATH domain-containing protein n=1 Tax=Haemaphysalis longicornis TaxID=44386 RepID=A0A9J6FVL3_HAELO|nr:hypothetical protein HPB48_006189 [Haemaphysalis longicornis]
MFLEMFSEIELLKTRLVALADSVRVVTSGPEGATTDLRPRRDIIVTNYTWVVGPYSRLRVGVNYVDSPVFFIAPGYKAQLQARIDGLAMVVLSVSVKVHKTDASDIAGPSEVPWPFQRTYLFALLHNSDDDRHLVKLFPPCDAFNEPQAPANPPDNEVSASSWLEICKLENAVFERDNVKDDTF